MPTATMSIETYTVRTGRSTSTPSAVLTLAGPVLSHGIQNNATLYFFPSYAQFAGWGLNIGGLNFDGITVIATIPFDDFPRMYDLLRNEAPVQLHYNYGASSSTTKALTYLDLRTGNEPVGEGPEDEDAVESAIQGLLAARTIELGGAKR